MDGNGSLMEVEGGWKWKVDGSGSLMEVVVDGPNEPPYVFLADFGLSKVMNEFDVAGTTTMKAGTPGFQAPEQLKSEGISAKCDMHTFGGVLTEIYGEMPLWPKMAPHQIMFNVTVKVYILRHHIYHFQLKS